MSNPPRLVTLDIRQRSPHDEQWSCERGANPGTREYQSDPRRAQHAGPPPTQPTTTPFNTNANARNQPIPLDSRLSISGGGLWAAADLVTPMAIRVAATLRLADHIAAGTQTTEGLAAAVDADRDALGRLLGHLVSAGVMSRAGAGSQPDGFG